jgi:hypothetical protein
MKTIRVQSLFSRPGCAKKGLLGTALIVLLSAGLSACAGLVASPAGTGNPGGSNQPTVSLSTNSLSFSNQTVGTQSAAQSITLTNTSTVSLSVSGISASGNFTQTNTCGSSLNAGSNCSISVTFSPATTGSLSGSVSITDNAPGSPQSISLSGTGSSGGGGSGSACLGTSLSQSQTNVTSLLSYVNTAAGVQVNQLTDNATNRFYYFDIPAYSPLVNQIFYDNYSAANAMVTSNPDGTQAQIVSAGATGDQPFLTADGVLAYYDKPVIGGVPGGEDLFGVFLNTSGACQELRLTSVDLPAQSPLPVWEISSASPDPAGGYDIAFSPDNLVHRVHVLANGTSQLLPTVTLNDPESAGTFHRIRENPVFPNIFIYKRNQTAGSSGTPELWLVDINTCSNNVCAASQIINMVQNLPTTNNETPKGDHMTWSPDGLDLNFLEPDIGDSWMAENLINPNGTINSNFTLLELGPFNTMTADYCVFTRDWPTANVIACVAGPASQVDAKTFYLMSTDGKGTTKLLASSDAQVITINGTPMPQFAQDDQHLLFNSDRTGVPEIYMISGFTLSVP